MIDEKKLKREDLCDICRNACCVCFEDDDFEEWIASQPKVGEWIPVSERLLETDENVLVIVNGKCGNVIFDNAVELGAYDPQEGWILEYYLEWINPNVIAWMSLPEPYEE